MTYTNKQYRFISEMIWGSVPIDRNWAENTVLFKDQAPILLKEYPNLEKSLYEKNSLIYKNGAKLGKFRRFLFRIRILFSNAC